MRRRTMLVAGGACFVAIAGCTGDRDLAADQTPSEPTEPTPSHAQSRADFRSAVEQTTDYVETMSLEGTDWTVAYSYDSSPEPFEDHQATLARNFSSVRPENVSLTVTTFHECMDIHWRIPARLAREHRDGGIDTETYVDRVQNTTTRENKC